MKKIDSDIKIYSSYDSHDFVRRMGTNKEYDGVVIHPYSGTINSSDSKYYEKILYRAEERVADVKAYEDLMKSILGEENSKDKKVVVSEYGMFRDDSRFVKSQVNAIYTAKSLIGFADISSVPYADKHCLIDFPEGDLLGPGQQAIIQSIVNKETGEIDFVATPTAKVFTLFNKMTGKHVLEENVINNKLLNIDRNRNLEAVETMVSKDDEGNIYLMMVNAAKEETDVRVQIKGFDFKGKSGNVMRVDGPSYDAENTVNNKNNVVVEEENLTPSKNSYLEYTLNPHSITAIKIIDAEFDYKLELQKEIKETKSLYDDSVEGFNVGEYHEGAKIKLNEALSNAQLVLEKENSTEEELIQSIKDLNLAKDIFNSFKIEEKTGDFNNNKKIDIGDLALVSRNYNSSNNQYDLNGDGLVGDYEIKFLNFRILN
ncbi:alpha-L-arabinofuranosidase C-terminal domain-containing protein [Clostridium perfringens]